MHMHLTKNPHATLKGGGLFGYCWTGGYGCAGTTFRKLALNWACTECTLANQDMHAVAKRLYDLHYKDKAGWWVQAWFCYST